MLGAVRDDLAVVDDRDVRAQELDFLHVVTRVEQGHALTVKLLQRFQDAVA